MESDRPETSRDEELEGKAAVQDERLEMESAENEIDGSSSLEEAQTPVDTIHQPDQPRRSWFGSVMHFLFSSETAVGRGMRRILRWTAFVLVLFAAGALTMYFWRVRPTEQILAQTAAQLVAVQNEIDGARSQVAASQSEVSAMQERVQAAESAAQAATQRLQLTTLRNDIAAARVALIADKDVAAAILNVSAAESDLKELKPVIDRLNATLADELLQHLTRIQKGLNTRPVNQAGLANELFAFDVKLLGLQELMFPE